MSMTNLTGDGDPSKSFQQKFCLAEVTTGVRFELICLVTLNICLSITALLGNAIILVALHKESSLYPPTKLLFRCLATTDLCVGTISEPLNVINLISVVRKRWNICYYSSVVSFIMGYILASVSLLTITALSVDRLLALLLGLRYRHVVTLKRTYLATTVFWVLPIVSTALYFWNNHITLWYDYIGVALCLLTSTFSYTKIFVTLRRYRSRVENRVQQEHPSQSIPLNISRYRKAVSSALWLQLTLVVCYLPFGIADVLFTQGGLSSTVYAVREFGVALVFLNSSLNPIVYCWKIREVRQAVKDTIRHLFVIT